MLRCVLLVGVMLALSSIAGAQERAATREAAALKWSELDWSEPTRQLAQPELRLRFQKAIKALRGEPNEHSRGIEELQMILSDDGDCLVARSRPSFRGEVGVIPPQHIGATISLKTVIEHIIAELPEDGRKFYELKFGSEAAAGLKHALQTEDIAELEVVARQYLLTHAGREAAYRLASHALEKGQPAAALKWIDRARLGAIDSNELEPAMSLKRIVALLRIGRANEATQALDEFLKGPAAKAGAEKLPKTLRDELDPTLNRIAASGRHEPAFLTEWTHYLGDAARTGRPLGVGTPEFGLWNVSTFHSTATPTAEQLKKYRYDPKKGDAENGLTVIIPKSDGDMVAAMQVGHDRIISEERDTREIALPSNYPLVIEGKAVFRTLSRIRAVDLKSGRNLWESAAVDPAYADLFALEPPTRWDDLEKKVDHSSVFSPLTKWHQALIETRTRSDRSVGTLSSDGQRVFFLDACGVASPRGATGVYGTKSNVPNLWNRLCALELATGKALWEIGAPISPDEPTTGEFFLGVPTVVDGRLYAIAESKDDVRLLCLDPSDGSVLWTETMCRLITGQNVISEGLRRIAAMSPTYCNGQLLCPTTCGFLLAYDLKGRRWDWCYGYESSSMHPDSQFRQPGLRFATGPIMKWDALRSESRWSESTIVSDGNRAVMASVDSNELHCLDLLTGAVKWRSDRQSAHYVAGLFEGLVIVVDRDRVRALSLESGDVVWALSLEDRFAAGRGVLSGGFYLLPVARLPETSKEDEPLLIRWDSRVLTIDLKTGTIASQSARSGDAPLGNLIAGNGFLVAQGYDRLRAFPPLSEVESLLAQQLAQNPKNAEALARRGRLRLQQQREDDGMSDLLTSLQVQPNDDVRQTLIEVSLDRLRTGKTNAVELREFLKRIGASNDVLQKLLRSEIESLRAKGEFVAAFEKTLEWMKSIPTNGTSPTDVIGEVSRYRRRGPAALLGTLYRQAAEAIGSEARAALDRVVIDRFDAAMKAAGARELLSFVDTFGWHPKSLEARWELATSSRLDEKQEFLQRERQALFLSRYPNAEIAAPALLALFALWTQTDRAAAHPAVVEAWSRRMAGVTLADGSSFESKLRELAAVPTVQKRRRDAEWGSFTMLEKVDPNRRPADREMVRLLGAISPAMRDRTIEIETAGRDVRAVRRMVARDALGRELWQIPMPFDGGSSLGAAPIANLSHGHLLAAYSAGRLTVIDISNEALPKPIWNRDIVNFDAVYGRNGAEVMPITVGVYEKRPAQRWHLTVAARNRGHEFTGSVDAITSECVITRTDQKLTASDSLTGHVLWERNNVKPNARVLADDEFIVLNHPTGTAEVLRLFDGELVASTSVADFETHLTSAGRDLVQWDDEEARSVLRRVDALTNKVVWRHEFSNQAVVHVVDHESVAVMQPTGEFQLFDIWTGKPVVSAKLPPTALIKNILVVPSPDGFVVMTDLTSAARTIERRQMPVPTLEFSQVRGHVSLVKFDSSVSWSTVLPLQRYLIGQPRESPVLIFRREAFVRVSDQEGGAKRTNDFFLVDKQSGKVIFDERPERGDDSQAIEILPDDGEVHLQFEQLRLQLKYQK